jgi:hypothetical protein
MTIEKLYVVVRADMPAGDQLSQSCHAVAEFGVLNPERFTAWATAQRNIVILAAPSMTALSAIAIQLERDGVQFAAFHEPDMFDELTAIAFGDEAAKSVSQLPLALRAPRAVAA